MEAAVSSTSTCWHLKKAKFVCLSEKTWSPLKKKKKKGGVPYVMEKSIWRGWSSYRSILFCSEHVLL